MNEQRIRDYHIDNIKIFLLFIIALGHNMIPFRQNCDILNQVIKIIYYINMPLFSLCSGYLVHKSKHNIWQYEKKLLVPYIVFQMLYITIGYVTIRTSIIDYSTNTMKLSLVEPSSPLYFLICMMVWRLLCPIFDQIESCKLIVIIVLVLAGCLLSCDPCINTIILPIIYLLPFYYCGYSLDWDAVNKKIDNISVSKSVMALILLIGLSLFIPYEIILFRINIYQGTINKLVFGLLKFLYYILAVIASSLVIKFASKRKIRYITQMAQSGMIIYIGSTFLSPYLYIVVYNRISFLHRYQVANIICLVFFTLFVIWVCSWKCWMKLYNIVIGRILR